MNQKINKKKILFFVVFVILGVIAFQIPFTHILGSKQTFTAFDFISPITGGFLGSWFGALTIGVVEIINFFVKKSAFDLSSFIRFWPAIAAAIYFGSKSKWVNVIPLFCIILFLANPIGRTVWYYPLAFWFIPMLCSFGKSRHLSLNALGSTFTAHAVGSTAFLYAFNLPAITWQSLMTIVPVERLTFAVGIVVSYIVVNNILNYLAQNIHISSLEPLVNKNLVINNKSLLRNL